MIFDAAKDVLMRDYFVMDGGNVYLHQMKFVVSVAVNYNND